MASSVTLRGICKNYGAVEVLKDIDLEIRDGEFVVLVGPSGCGKSTLLRCISGLEAVSDGTILIDDLDATKLNPVDRGVGMVFQSYALYPHMSVAENIGFGLRIAKRSKSEIDETVLEVAKLLKLDDLLDRKPRELSGGQRQRVAIGRSLARKPKIFLFDEPLSNLDAALRVQMRVELSTLHNDMQSTMIYVTHDQVEAMTLSNRIVVMRDGMIMQVGAPLELFNNPSKKFVAGFLGQPSTNFIGVERTESKGEETVFHFGQNSISVQGVSDSYKSAVEIGLRPNVFAISPEKATLHPRVEIAEQLGDETLVHTTLDTGERLVAKIAGQYRITPGDKIPLAATIAHPMAFDAEERNLFYTA